MYWTVDEVFVEGKQRDRDCEDVIVVSDDLVAVIDGATDETGARFRGKSGGKFAADVIADALRGLPGSVSPRTFANCLTDALATAVAIEAGIPSPESRWPVASVVCLAPAARQVWRIGDCHVRIGDTPYPGAKRVDDASYGFRAVINAAQLAKGMPLEQILAEDPGAEASRPLYDLQQHLANTTGPWGYGCINGRPIPDEHIDVLTVPPGPCRVVLASDGYPVPHSTLEESEAHLAASMASDPAAIGDLWQMGKSLKPGSRAMDDRAFVSVNIGE
jgi:hypothetical protein